MTSTTTYDSKVQAKGEVQIPRAIVDHLKLEAGDRLIWYVGNLGTVFVLKGQVVTADKGGKQ